MKLTKYLEQQRTDLINDDDELAENGLIQILVVLVMEKQIIGRKLIWTERKK